MTTQKGVLLYQNKVFIKLDKLRSSVKKGTYQNTEVQHTQKVLIEKHITKHLDVMLFQTNK